MNTADTFEQLVHEHTDMLTTYLRSLVGAPQLAEDLYQETMITAWQKLDTYHRDRPFGPWLRGIARNLALVHYRTHKREMLMCNPQIMDYLDNQFNHIDQHHGESWLERIHNLNDCLQKLPEKLRLAIYGRYYSELKTTEILEQFNISKEALKKRLQRGKLALAKCLKKHNTLLAETHLREEAT